MLNLEIKEGMIFFTGDSKDEILMGIEYLAKQHPRMIEGKQVTNLEPNFKRKKYEFQRSV